MKKIKKQVTVCAFKYNGWKYRIVTRPYVLFESPKVICLYLPPKMVKSIKNEEGSRRFFCSLNAYSILWFFFKDEWFNVMVSGKANKMNFYVNLASPYIFENNSIKYIDFDLDFKIIDSKNFRIIDKDEYLENMKKWCYPISIKQQIKQTQLKIIALIKEEWFNELFNFDKISALNKCLSCLCGNENIEQINEYKKFIWKHGK